MVAEEFNEADAFEVREHPAFLIGYLKGLASRLGEPDEPILLATADYIEAGLEDCDCPDGAEEKCINILCPRK